jgi:hypothetical protein
MWASRAALVLGTGAFWPDVAVAALMASLALYSAGGVILHARSELRPQRTQ